MSFLYSIFYTWGKSGHKFATLALTISSDEDDDADNTGKYYTETTSRCDVFI